MAFLPTLLLSLLLGMTPLIIAAILLPVLCQGAVLSLPTPFLTAHLFMSAFTRAFLDLAASVWLFLPIFPLLTLAPAFVSVYFSAALLYLLSHAVRSVAGSMNLFSELSREVHVKTQVYSSIEMVCDSLKEFFRDANFTEMFQNVKGPSGASYPFKPDNEYRNYNISEAIRNLTISESTQQYIDTVNVALIGLLEQIEVSNFFNTTRMPPHLYESFDKASETIRDLAAHLNFTEILREGTVPPHVQESFRTVGDALDNLGQNINVTELLETFSSNATKETLDPFFSLSELTDPATAFQSFGEYIRSGSWEKTAQDFLAGVPKNVHIAASAYIIFLLIGIPGLFFLRAALQDGLLWLVTRRYKSSVPSEQRSASGWMFVAALSGLVSAAAEAFPYCFIYFYLYNSNVLSPVSVFVLVLHSLTTVPLRASSHMRLAEASARRDVLKDSRRRFLSGFLLSAFANGIFNIWWLCFAGTLIMSRIIIWLPGFFVATDAIVVGFATAWGRAICQRLLRDERQMVEDRERKRD